jgi:hypothetical protein
MQPEATMQCEPAACTVPDAAATAVGADLLHNVVRVDADLLDIAADRWRRNLDLFARMATCGSPLAFALLSIEAATEATLDGFAFAQRLCGMLDPAVADSTLAVS